MITSTSLPPGRRYWTSFPDSRWIDDASRQLSPPKFEKIKSWRIANPLPGAVQIIMKKANATVQWIGIPEFLSRGIQHAC